MRYFKILFQDGFFTLVKTDSFSDELCFTSPSFLTLCNKIAEDCGYESINISSITEVTEPQYISFCESDHCVEPSKEKKIHPTDCNTNKYLQYIEQEGLKDFLNLPAL